MATNNLETLFNNIGINFPENIKTDIQFNLDNNDYTNKHYSFIVDMKTNKILSYDFNVYFKSDSFPFSIHAEIQSITKYYKSRSINKNKKILIVAKLSKTGVLGNSRCCLNCMRFIRNNFDNLNLKKVYYSEKNNEIVMLNKSDLIDKEFKSSKGYTAKLRQ
jgi:cytidine deaminase